MLESYPDGLWTRSIMYLASLLLEIPNVHVLTFLQHSSNKDRFASEIPFCIG